MLNTGLRTGEALGLLNSDIDLENRVIHLQRGVKEVSRREGTESTSGREVKIGKLKSTSSKRDVPLNQAAVDATGWAAGSQDCMGIMPALAPKPTIIRQYATSSSGWCSAAREKSMAPPG